MNKDQIRREDLIQKMISMNEVCVTENRSFSDEEQVRYEEYQDKLDEIERQERIRTKQEMRRHTWACQDDEIRKDGKNMEFTNAMKDLLKKEGLVNMTDLEVRAGNGVTDSSHVSTKHARPENFLDQVFMDATHDNLLVQLCHVVQSASETKLLIGAEIGKMVALSELEELQVKDFETSMKQIVPQRMGIGTVVSRLMIETEVFDVASHVQRLFAKSLALTIEAEIAKTLDQAEDIPVAVEAQDQSVLNTIVGVLATFPENLRANSVILVNPTTYSKILMEQDGVCRNLLSFEFDESLRAKVCGVPIVVSEEVQGLYVGNLQDVLAVAVNMNRFEGENLPRQNAVSFTMNVYMGATIKLPKAMRKITLAE